MIGRGQKLQVSFEVDGDGKVVRAFTNLTQESNKSARSLDRSGDAADKAGDRMKRLGDVAKTAGAALGVGATVAGTALVMWTREVTENAFQVERLAKLANSSATEIQRWGAAATQVGVDHEKLGDILKDMQDRIGDFITTGGGELQEFFDEIAPAVGVTIEQFRNLSGPQALQLFYTTLERANLSQEQMVFMLESVADEATLLQPLLRDNGRGFQELGDQAERFGAIMDEEALASARALRQDMIELDLVFTGLKAEIAEEMIPIIRDLTGVLQDLNEEGEGVEEAMDVIASGFDLVVGSAKVVSSTIRGVTADLIAFGNLHQASFDLFTFDLDGFKRNLREAKVAREMAAEESADIGRVFSGGTDPAAPAPQEEPIDIVERMMRPLPTPMQSRPIGRASEADSDRAAADALRAQAEAEREAARAAAEHARARAESLRQLEDWEAELAGPVAQTMLDYQRRQQELDHDLGAGVLTAEEYARATGVLTEMREREVAAIEQQLDPATELIARLEDELRLRTLNNAQARTAIDLAHLGGQATDAQIARIEGLHRALEEQAKNIRFMDELRSSVVDLGLTAVDSFDDVDDAFKEMMDNLALQVTRRILEGWVEQLFGSMGSTGQGTGGGNWINGLIGSLFGGGTGGARGGSGLSIATADSGFQFQQQGGTNWWDTAASLFAGWFGGGRAYGGDVEAGRLYRVNEFRRPEMLSVGGQDFLMMGSQDGHVSPDSARPSGDFNQTVNLVVQGRPDRRTPEQVERATGRAARRAMARTGP